MFLLFCLIIMRMSGAVIMHPVLGRTNYPARVKAALIFSLSLLLYIWTGGVLQQEPSTLLEFGVMLVQELFIGFCMGIGMDLVFFSLRYATAVIDHAMGLTMAHVFDPSTSSQSTVTTGLLYAFLVLLFLVTDGHLRFLELIFRSAELIPFGGFRYSSEIPQYMLRLFSECFVRGMQMAFPILGIELMVEVALGILMRVVQQINVFQVNFQIKIIVGLLMLFFLLTPIADRMKTTIEYGFEVLESILSMLLPR